MCWQVYWWAERIFLCKLVAFVVLVVVFLPQVVSKIPDISCSHRDPLPILHKYYQPGDQIIAGIMSHLYRFSKVIKFKECPSNDIFEEPM